MSNKRLRYKPFDFGKPKHAIFVQPQHQDAARKKSQARTRYNNLKRAAEKRIEERG